MIMHCKILRTFNPLIWIVLLLVPTLGYSATPPFKSIPQIVQSAEGSLLADSAGMTLYTYDNDYANESTCTGVCSTNWPPFLVEGKPIYIPRNFTIIEREGGQLQWAYKNKPLYRWNRDQVIGDTTGDNFNSLWHIVPITPNS